MKAIKIKMKRNCGNSGNVQDIDSIYIDGIHTGRNQRFTTICKNFPKLLP